ncbi:hypothetical protein [Stigmatella hybrida]|uniref:hypothetical protein n=1 Tax=Stigmatella hybrida TaxID=394097 RepID=UPI001CDAA9F8|nr:hypothetical protein [Stigmatella hybrida]
MTSTRREWWNTIAREKDYLNLSLFHSEVPFNVTVRVLKDFEHRFLREARTPAERLHIQRLTTKDVLVQAYGDARPWRDFGPHLLRMKRLGFPDLGTRVLIACLYVQALGLFPERARDAFALLADAERRVRRLPKTRRGRQQWLDGITGARRMAEMQGLRPAQRRAPRPPGRPGSPRDG